MLSIGSVREEDKKEEKKTPGNEAGHEATDSKSEAKFITKSSSSSSSSTLPLNCSLWIPRTKDAYCTPIGYTTCLISGYVRDDGHWLGPSLVVVAPECMAGKTLGKGNYWSAPSDCGEPRVMTTHEYHGLLRRKIRESTSEDRVAICASLSSYIGNDPLTYPHPICSKCSKSTPFLLESFCWTCITKAM
jgi:hypothetical protein